MCIRQNVVVSLVLAISMVGVSYGAGGVLPGNGLSESTAYLIEDLADFDVFANQANAATYWSSGVYTKLACDPNLTGRPYITAVIAPDTSTDSDFQGVPFAGVFDGDGHVIRNLTINTVGAGNDYLGLFGNIGSYSAEIKNLGIKNINITGGADSDYLGGLCGCNGGWGLPCGTITNCYATGSVTGGADSYPLGGLCGSNGGTIINCYATGSVTGGNYSRWLGGLCGINHGTITNCYAAGPVTGGHNSDSLGGLCGAAGDEMTITNCYATGSVTSGDNSEALGGLCGINYDDTIINCYATGLVTGGNNLYKIGGLCGYNRSGTITNCFWDVETSGMSVSDGGTGKTTAQMQTESTFTDANWDFDVEPLWKMSFYETGYPILAWQWNGDGSQEKPYLIENMADFDVFADQANAATYWSSGVYTKLACDPNLTGRIYAIAVIAPDTDNTNFDFDGISFEGNFDGNGHVVRNLTINTLGAGNDYLGLFGEISGSSAEIKNLGLANINIAGGNHSRYLGGLCGSNYYSGSISNCYVTGSVTGGVASYYLGGMCGENYNGKIVNCYTTGSVSGGGFSWYLGGLCGFNFNGSNISNCYSTGSVTGGDHSRKLGGLCGENHCSSISNCYSTGDVTGGDYSECLGGLCGDNFNGSSISNCYSTGSVSGGDSSKYLGGLCGCNYRSSINNCYSIGSVTGGGYFEYLGGLCGYNYESSINNCYSTGSVTGVGCLGGLCGYNRGPITNCFWDVETSGIGIEGDDNYGATGKTTEQMQTQSTFTDVCWDFSVVPVWRMPFQAVGYPMLGWQKDVPGDFTGCYGVDMVDFAVLADTWGLASGQAGYDDLCDLIDDDTIDLDDLGVFVENWLAGM